MLRYVNLFQTLTRQPVFILALSALISVCGSVCVYNGKKRGERKRGEGGLRLLWEEVCSACVQ